MTNKILLISVIIFFLFPVYSSAQFINLQLRVEPELTATVERSLDFGTQITNSGRTEVLLGDANMGIFKIQAFYTQNIYLDLNYPDALTNTNPTVNASIPLQLDLAYNNTGGNSVGNAIPLPANNGLVSIYENTQEEFDNEIWKEMYIFVYGAIEVGNIPNGTYTGNIVLSVDYD